MSKQGWPRRVSYCDPMGDQTFVFDLMREEKTGKGIMVMTDNRSGQEFYLKFDAVKELANIFRTATDWVD